MIPVELSVLFGRVSAAAQPKPYDKEHIVKNLFVKLFSGKEQDLFKWYSLLLVLHVIITVILIK